MAHAGQELEGPNGYRLRLVSIEDDLLEMEATYSGEGGFISRTACHRKPSPSSSAPAR